MKLNEAFNFIDDKFILESEHKKSVINIRYIALAAACLCLVLCCAVIIFKNEQLPIDSSSFGDSSLVSSEGDGNYLDERVLFYQMGLNAPDIQIKQIKTMTREELFDYYGYSFDLSEVFEGIHEKPNDYSIRVGVDGVIYSHNTFSYHLGDKKISIGIRKGEGELNTGAFEKSIIYGRDVIILDYGDYLLSYFNCSGNLICVASSGFSEDELVKTISYLVNNNEDELIKYIDNSIYINPASFEYREITADKVEELEDGRLLYTFIIYGDEHCIYGKKGEEPPTLGVIDAPITKFEVIREEK